MMYPVLHVQNEKTLRVILEKSKKHHFLMLNSLQSRIKNFSEESLHECWVLIVNYPRAKNEENP